MKEKGVEKLRRKRSPSPKRLKGKPSRDRGRDRRRRRNTTSSSSASSSSSHSGSSSSSGSSSGSSRSSSTSSSSGSSSSSSSSSDGGRGKRTKKIIKNVKSKAGKAPPTQRRLSATDKDSKMQQQKEKDEKEKEIREKVERDRQKQEQEERDKAERQEQTQLEAIRQLKQRQLELREAANESSGDERLQDADVGKEVEREKMKLQRELVREKRPGEFSPSHKENVGIRRLPLRPSNRRDSSEESVRENQRRESPKRRRSVSPTKRFSAPRRRSPTPRRRSSSPRRRHVSPRRRYPSPPRRRSPVRRPPPRRRLPSQEGGGSRSPSPANRRNRSSSPVKPIKLFIGNLTRNVNKDHILEIFSSYGRIRSIDLPLDTKNLLPRGHAYVVFDRSDDGRVALRHMNGGWVDGQEITAKEVLGAPSVGINNWNNRGGANRGRGSQWRRRSPARFGNQRPPVRRASRSPRRRSRTPRGPRRRRGSVSSGSSSPSPQRRRSSPSSGRRRRYSRSSSDSE